MTDKSRSPLYHGVGAENGHGDRGENTPLLEAGGLQDSYQENGPIDDSAQSHANSKGQAGHLEARLFLFFVAFLYGSLNVSLRMVYARPGPPSASVLSTTRGWLAVTCFLPLLRMVKTSPSGSLCPESAAASSLPITEENRKFMFWRFAFELALFNFGTQGLINLGLLTVESARAAFLTQLSVVITPIISAFFGHKVVPKTWFACFVALVGLYILSTSGGLSMHFTMGDVYCIGSAFCWSYYIYRMSAWGDYFDDLQTQFVKNIMLASMYTIWMVTALLSVSEKNLWEGWRDGISWLILLYSALGPCTIADIIQQRAQSIVPAAESNVILSLEPVFTVILGLILLGEVLSFKEQCGGGLIILASILASA